jgi:hypothetical protein
METPEAVLLSQLPLILMAVLFFFELTRIRKILETITRRITLYPVEGKSTDIQARD